MATVGREESWRQSEFSEPMLVFCFILFSPQSLHVQVVLDFILKL